jgi:hypothetical protein
MQCPKLLGLLKPSAFGLRPSAFGEMGNEINYRIKVRLLISI